MTYRLGSATVGIGTSTGTVFKTKLNKLGLYPTSDIKFSSGVWIVAQYQNMSFAVSAGTLHTSTDNSVTFPTTTAFTDANKIREAIIWDNGNINFFTNDNKAYLTTTSLSVVNEIFVKEADGTTNMTFHTPANATYPGWYFDILTYQPTGYRDNVRVFTNYGNAYESGAQPTNVYASSDNGATWRRVFEFGQNPNYRDDGTADGGTTGTLLGDSGNSNICRHGHSINWIPSVGKWLLVVGDDNAGRNENGWYWLTEAATPNPWTAERIDFGITIETTHRLKSIQPIEYDGYIYWGSDNQEVTDTRQNGIWRVPTASLVSSPTDLTAHRQLFAIEEDYGSSIVDFRIDLDSGVLFGMINDSWSPTVTRKRLFAIENYGLGKVHYYKDASADFKRMSDKNEDGYWLMDYEGRIPLQSTSFMIKIGNDFFDNL